MRTALLAAALLTLCSVGSHAQEPPVFQAEVELVQIEVRATDRDGEPVSDLGLGDFVLEGGQPFPDRSHQMIRFIAWLDTEKLPPGRYTMLAVLPNYQMREVPDLSEDFEVLAQ